MPSPVGFSASTTVDRFLIAVNRSYNDHPAVTQGGEPKRVLFLDEADAFVARNRSLGTREQQVAAYRELAKRVASDDVFVTYNAANALSEYGREIGARKRIRPNEL